MRGKFNKGGNFIVNKGWKGGKTSTKTK